MAAGFIADANPADAANGDPLVLGQANTATATTSVSTSSGPALQGRTTANGNIGGVEGFDASPNGATGVFGSSAKGYGVYGVSGANYGVVGNSVSSNGVYGVSESGNGVYGHCDRGTAGVYGDAGNSHAGVWGQADGLDGCGVMAIARGAGGTGVWGIGEAPSGGSVFGVVGDCGTNPYGYGVYAFAQKGIALYAAGKAHVTGTLSKGGGSFKIDHPLDPAHKYLYHSFVESPDMMNVYNGTVICDPDGQATVELPDWFETLNRDFRYQLTPLLGAAPNLHVSALVADGRFSIAGGNAGHTVSWQVTGIRQDAWANANRIPVEADKPAHDQGRYLHPDLYEDGHGEPIEALMVGRRQRPHL